MRGKIYMILAFLSLLLACTDKSGHEENSHHEVKKIYTCPMHPGIIRDKPGQCPICGMELVEKRSEEHNIKETSLEFLLKPTDQYVLSQIKTIAPTEKELPVEFTSIGTITYDPSLINTVSARVAGRVEKLYVKYRFQPISKGQKLMDIYSKDLVIEQENYIFLLQNDPDNQPIIKAAENKLGLLGLSNEQINTLKNSKKVIQSISIFSPYSGHLHDVQSMKPNEGMGASKMDSRELAIHEGMYVEKGQTVFNIYGTEKVWAILSIYPGRQEALKKGSNVRLRIDGVEDPVSGKIDFIEPVIRQDLKTITARVHLDNPKGELKIGAIAEATISGAATKGRFLPEESILNLGQNDIVFVKKENLFEATLVKTGSVTDGWVQLLSGLKANDSVAENAHLLMDSESFIKAGKP